MASFEYPVFEFDAYESICDQEWADELIAKASALNISHLVSQFTNSWLSASAIAKLPAALLAPIDTKAKIWEETTLDLNVRKSIYNAQSCALVLFFDAYERFMKSSVLSVAGLDLNTAVKQFPDFKTAFAETLGDAQLEKCWHNPWVQFFMSVRDCIIQFNSNACPLLDDTEHDIMIHDGILKIQHNDNICLLYTSPSPRD